MLMSGMGLGGAHLKVHLMGPPDGGAKELFRALTCCRSEREGLIALNVAHIYDVEVFDFSTNENQSFDITVIGVESNEDRKLLHSALISASSIIALVVRHLNEKVLVEWVQFIRELQLESEIDCSYVVVPVVDIAMKVRGEYADQVQELNSYKDLYPSIKFTEICFVNLAASREYKPYYLFPKFFEILYGEVKKKNQKGGVKEIRHCAEQIIKYAREVQSCFSVDDLELYFRGKGNTLSDEVVLGALCRLECCFDIYRFGSYYGYLGDLSSDDISRRIIWSFFSMFGNETVLDGLRIERTFIFMKGSVHSQNRVFDFNGGLGLVSDIRRIYEDQRSKYRLGKFDGYSEADLIEAVQRLVFSESSKIGIKKSSSKFLVNACSRGSVSEYIVLGNNRRVFFPRALDKSMIPSVGGAEELLSLTVSTRASLCIEFGCLSEVKLRCVLLILYEMIVHKKFTLDNDFLKNKSTCKALRFHGEDGGSKVVTFYVNRIFIFSTIDDEIPASEFIRNLTMVPATRNLDFEIKNSSIDTWNSLFVLWMSEYQVCRYFNWAQELADIVCALQNPLSRVQLEDYLGKLSFVITHIVYQKNDLERQLQFSTINIKRNTLLKYHGANPECNVSAKYREKTIKITSFLLYGKGRGLTKSISDGEWDGDVKEGVLDRLHYLVRLVS